MALRAQQHCFCVMFVSPSRLWVRARAGAWMLAVCEDERADGNAAEDGGVDWSPCTWQQGMVLGQAPRQRVGDECRRRLMSMLPCAMGSSAAPSAALAAATERPTVSAVSAAIVEWGVVPQTPTATTTSGSKVNECGSRAPGTRRAIEARGFCRSHGPYLACLRPITAPRLASSATVNSMGTTTRRSWLRKCRSGRSGLAAPAPSSSLSIGEVAQLPSSGSLPTSALKKAVLLHGEPGLRGDACGAIGNAVRAPFPSLPLCDHKRSPPEPTGS